jgi:hypothetical protein
MHIEGAMEIVHTVKNMSALKILDLNGLFDLIVFRFLIR